MDPQPNGGSSSGSSERKAFKRLWDDSNKDPPSLGSERSPCPPTESDSPEPGAIADGATTSKVLSSLEESHKTLDEDSESSVEDLAITRKSPGRDEERAGPISLSTVKNLNGPFTGETLDFRLPCTATEGTACQIVGHLSAWNEFLCLVSWELQEMPGTSGKLSLLFFRNPSLIYCSPQQLHLVTLLACQLLKTHRCVAHVELNIALFRSHHEILSDALRGSPSVTSVKLTFCGWISGEDLATAALSLPHLQELEYRGYAHDAATLVGRLSAFLRTTMSLTVLRVSCECLIGLSSDDIFGALSQNCSLKELVLPSRLFDKALPSAQAVFAECLKNSVSFTSLTVISGCPPSILKGLLGNRSIVAVDFRHAEVDQVDAQLTSEIFEQNKVLQSFKISYKFEFVLEHVEFVQGCPDKAGWDRCLKALIENHTLEEVALPINVWDEDQWKELFEALLAKRNLKRVSIEAIDKTPRSFLGKLCAALNETGADEKVSFNSTFTVEEFDERFECKAFSSVRVGAWDFNRAAFSRILSCMPSLGHITWLHLNLPLCSKLNGAPFSALTTFLGGTRTLKTLILNTYLDVSLYKCQEALMEGLALNTSLTRVQIYVDMTSSDFSEFSEPLADTINASRNISRVNFEVRNRDSAARAFLRRLSTGMPENYTLLSVTMAGYRKSERSWFKVWDATRRNFSLLTGAADFARGVRCDRRCALALERMHGHPELVEEVARLEKVDQARAAAMVRDGLRSIEGMHAFMRLAGVVKESVSCHARRDGRTQLDALNEDCWREIRRYVKLYDVKDLTTGVPAQ